MKTLFVHKISPVEKRLNLEKIEKTANKQLFMSLWAEENLKVSDFWL